MPAWPVRPEAASHRPKRNEGNESVCGIAGAIASDFRRDVGALVVRLTEQLAHRGPDGSGLEFLHARCAAFGHRRLSIVDLECGAQPMSNEDGRVWVVLNGELYNHIDLRRELEGCGHRFRTRADTEVLVHGWEEWGRAVLARLNGIYACAVFDGREGRGRGEVWLARDPAGVKPLYLGLADDMWWFASELGAARRCGLVNGDPRPEAFDEYLVYRFVPSPETFFRSTWKLPPGHVCRLSLESLPRTPAFERFETSFAPTAIPRSAAEWQEALRGSIAQAVRRQLMSDVPVGCLLSGGVDSTAVMGVMRDSLPEPPVAFGIGFKGEGRTDELVHARAAASALKVPLNELSTDERGWLTAWKAQVEALGEPIANPGLVLVGLLCQMVRRSHKVVLSGQGADEILGGYPRHVAERWYPILRRLQPLLRVLPEATASSDRVRRLGHIAAASDDTRRFTEILAVYSPREAIDCTGHQLDPDELAAPVRRWLPDDSDSVNRLLMVDARLSLADDLLTVADHMSMAWSVELRVPFLDLELLNLVGRMPSRYKISALGERKWLYRDSVRPLLPRSFRDSVTGWRARLGSKLGFATPLDSWLDVWVARDAEQYLLGPDARSPDYLRGDRLRRLLSDARDRGLPRTRQILSLYVLETWLRGWSAGVRGPELR